MQLTSDSETTAVYFEKEKSRKENEPYQNLLQNIDSKECPHHSSLQGSVARVGAAPKSCEPDTTAVPEREFFCEMTEGRTWREE